MARTLASLSGKNRLGCLPSFRIVVVQACIDDGQGRLLQTKGPNEKNPFEDEKVESRSPAPSAEETSSSGGSFHFGMYHVFAS